MGAPLILLCGPAFSGKSTVADHLARRWGFSVVSLDAINARRGLQGGAGLPDAEWARAAALAQEEVRGLLRTPGNRVVVDDTFCFRFLRHEFAALAAEAGRDSVLVVLGTPLAEVHRRIADNARGPLRPGINVVVLERHLASFEWPGDDEPHRAIQAASELDEWLGAEAGGW